MASIIVSGALANKPFNGGEAWVRLSWVLGFRRLGFDVCFVEQIASVDCRDAVGAVTTFDACVNREYFRLLTKQFGLSAPSCLIYQNGEQTEGLTFKEMMARADDAALLVNISGHLAIDPLLGRIRRKAYIDIDPGFTQFWHADPDSAFRVAKHDDYFTIGENIGTPACSIPTSGIDWRPIRQPVVLEHWPVCLSERLDRFTTVASWRGPYGPIRYGGKTFGLKVHEFRKFIEMPARSSAAFEIALDIHSADNKDRDLLLAQGWRLTDPRTAAGNPNAFRSYVQSSAAEFSVAQGVYVDTNCGWFSDRTVGYLASGKPALVQETGFSRNIPTGKGLFAFSTMAEAAAGARDIAGNYSSHCQAARSLAESLFDSDKILGRLLDDIKVAA